MRETTPCRKCGSQNPTGYTFCGKCGAELAATVQRRPTRMTWFERHVNWATVLGWLAIVVVFRTLTEVCSFVGFESGVTLFWIAGTVLVFVVAGWAIDKKGRSRLHILWCLAPFGWIVVLCLRNRRVQSETVDK